MFSGIIERLGQVRSITREPHAIISTLDTGFVDLILGESVAINGVCLTVTSFTDKGQATFYISNETLDKSNLGSLIEGAKVNLERALKLDTRLSGHMVQGHVDGKSTLAESINDGDAWRLAFDFPSALARYCVVKGSICLNGVSLTINDLKILPDGGTRLFATIIPHTWEHTNLNALKIGDAINVEVDVIAKYVERLCQPYLKP
jgi:riboflavin synthase